MAARRRARQHETWRDKTHWSNMAATMLLTYSHTRPAYAVTINSSSSNTRTHTHTQSQLINSLSAFRTWHSRSRSLWLSRYASMPAAAYNLLINWPCNLQNYILYKCAGTWECACVCVSSISIYYYSCSSNSSSSNFCRAQLQLISSAVVVD